MAHNRLWVIEFKYHKRGRHWMPSLDHGPFIYEVVAIQTAQRRQKENPGWEYRASEFLRAK